ncbi:integrase, catalytic region, zinc finger, CCHC-type containing protein [Tanacetum coccineum]
MNFSEPTLSIRPTNVEVPKELPKVSMVNTSLKKLKHHLANFDVVVKERTTPTAITEAHSAYIKHSQEEAAFLKDLVDHIKANHPLDPLLESAYSRCSKHMIGDRSQLTNFVNKFLGTVKFGNDHVAKIMGYGDYQIGNVTISRVYYVEGLGHNLFSVGQFYDSNLEVTQEHEEKLYLLHMDLCGPMRVASVNGKKYILVIVDDYS